MVEISPTVCPYCKLTSYFEKTIDNGYCTHCGKIIYADHSATIVTEKIDEIPKSTLSIIYLHKSLSSYAKSIKVEINGPETKTIVANSYEEECITLPNGEYHIICTCHIAAGVNSKDIMTSINISLKDKVRLQVTCGTMFSEKLTISKI